MYSFLRRIFVFVTAQFFREIKLRGAAPVEKGPALILSNHPNFALDALVVLTAFRRELWFLAKGTIFSNPILRKVFTWLHMVPVYRRQDDPAQTSKNQEAFKVATETLRRGEAIMMFPEGVSMGERKLSPMKTGAARIAFLTEAAASFSAGLVIQPVGLTYRDLVSFQTDVIITLGEPIVVADFRAQYESDPTQAVNLLTDQIEETLRKVSVEVADQSLTRLVEDVTQLFASAYPERDDHGLMQRIAKNVQLLAPQYPAQRTALHERIQAFLALLAVFRLDAATLNDTSRRSKAWIYLLCPLVLLGAVVFYIPYRLVGIIVSGVLSHPVEHPVETASYKLGFGVLVFIAWLALLIGIGAWIGLSLGALALGTVGLVALGVVTNRYLAAAKLFAISLLWPSSQNPVEVLRLLRDQLVSELEQLRVQ